jgi:hypothetical protein
MPVAIPTSNISSGFWVTVGVIGAVMLLGFLLKVF